MKVFFDVRGNLAVEAEDMTERFALLKWYESYDAGETVLKLRWEELLSELPYATPSMEDARQLCKYSPKPVPPKGTIRKEGTMDNIDS